MYKPTIIFTLWAFRRTSFEKIWSSTCTSGDSTHQIYFAKIPIQYNIWHTVLLY